MKVPVSVQRSTQCIPNDMIALFAFVEKEPDYFPDRPGALSELLAGAMAADVAQGVAISIFCFIACWRNDQAGP